MKNSIRSIVLLIVILISANVFAGSRLGKFETSHINQIPAFYTQDFAGGLPSSWQAVDNAGGGVNWKYTTTGIYNSSTYPGEDSLSISGTTAANGYMMYDSDSAGGVQGENSDLISGAINCSARAYVHLTFYQFLKHYNESPTVSVSNDSVNWVTVYNASTNLTSGQATSNPDFVDVDITTVAGNQAKVFLKFNFTGDYDYFWMIDDVALYAPVAKDAAILSVDGPTTSCTLLGATEHISVSLFNNGTDTLKGFNITFIADANAPVTELAQDTILAGQTKVYTFTAPVDFSGAGAHTILSYVTFSGDTNTTNDSARGSLFSGPHTINLNPGTTNYGMGFEANEDLSGWYVQDVNNDSITWEVSNSVPNSGALCARISTSPSTVVNDWLFTTCLNLNSASLYQLDFFYRAFNLSTHANLEIKIGSSQSDTGMTQTILPAKLINTISYQQLNPQALFSVPADGVYYIGFHVTNDSTLSTSLRLDDINISYQGPVGIASVQKENISLFPNPATGIVYLRGNQNSSTGFNVDVVNSVGQSVYTTKMINLMNQSIDLSSQPTGIYLVRIVSDQGVITQPIVLSSK